MLISLSVVHRVAGRFLVEGCPGLAGGSSSVPSREWARAAPSFCHPRCDADRAGWSLAASEAVRSPSCFCWLLMSPGGWDARATTLRPVRPSSAPQPWMWGQSRCPSGRSRSAAVSARVIAVIAALRSSSWPGSQDTSQPCLLGACRAVWAGWSLVIVVSLMVKVMAVTSGSGSWFGFQVEVGVAVVVFAVVQAPHRLAPEARKDS